MPARRADRRRRLAGLPTGYLARIQADTTDLSPAVAALALRAWGRLHGLVTLEVHGHLRPAFNEPATLFEAVLLDVVGSAGTASIMDSVPGWESPA